MIISVTSEIVNQITNYVRELDWMYILTFIVIAYGFNHVRVKQGIEKVTRVKSKTKYRVALVGVLYGITLYFTRGYSLENIEGLFQSFVFAFVFHKMIIEGLIHFITKRFTVEK